MISQLELALAVPKRQPPDYEGEARRELTDALSQAKAAIDRPPWDRRQQSYWRIVFPQMAGWLPEDERARLVHEFMAEIERIEPMFEAQP